MSKIFSKAKLIYLLVGIFLAIGFTASQAAWVNPGHVTNNTPLTPSLWNDLNDKVSGITTGSGGSVGIGTTNPTGQLQVNGGPETTAGYNKSVVLYANHPVVQFKGVTSGKSGFIGYDAQVGPEAMRFWVGGTTDDPVANSVLAMSIKPSGNIGIGTTNPSSKLDINGDVTTHGNINTLYGGIIPSNRGFVGLEFNKLFNATERFTVSQSGPATLSLSRIFDGKLDQQYFPMDTLPSESSPYVLTIEGLPNLHIQNGGFIGWTSRYNTVSNKFKIECYDEYYNYGWQDVVNVDDPGNRAGIGYNEYAVKVPHISCTKIRFTFYRPEDIHWFGLSEVFFIHQEATRAYEGLLPSSITEGQSGTVNIRAYADSALNIDKQVGSMWNYVSLYDKGNRTWWYGSDSSGNFGIRSDDSTRGMSINASDGMVNAFNGLSTPYIVNGIADDPVIAKPDGGAGQVSVDDPFYVSNNAYVAGQLSYNTLVAASDARFKKNITVLKSSLEKITKLQGVNFNWNNEAFPDKNFDSTEQIGFIAQEVEKIIPEIVSTDQDGYKGVSYEKLTPVLVEAIKEQDKKIQALIKIVCLDHPTAEVCR